MIVSTYREEVRGDMRAEEHLIGRFCATGLLLVCALSCSSEKPSASTAEGGRAGSSGVLETAGSQHGGASAGAGGVGAALDTAGRSGSAAGDAPIVDAEGVSFPASAECPEPPASESSAAIEALHRINYWRLLAGAPCLKLIPELSVAAHKHCIYHVSNANDARCTSDAHGEKPNCQNFVAASASDRVRLAGYTATPKTEAIAFVGRPASAVQRWIDTVWHRTALLYPWFDEIGYGGIVAPGARAGETTLNEPVLSATLRDGVNESR